MHLHEHPHRLEFPRGNASSSDFFSSTSTSPSLSRARHVRPVRPHIGGHHHHSHQLLALIRQDDKRPITTKLAKRPKTMAPVAENSLHGSCPAGRYARKRLVPSRRSRNTLSREHPRCLFPFPPKQVGSVAEGIWLEHLPPQLRLTGRTPPPSQLSSGSLINLNRNAGFLSISHSGTFARASLREHAYAVVVMEECQGPRKETRT